MIVLIGGGEIGRPGYPYETFEIDSLVVELSNRTSPKILFIGWAQVPYGLENESRYFGCIEKVYRENFGCKVEPFYYNDLINGKSLDCIEEAEVIYIGGGDTVFLSKLVLEFNIAPSFKKAHDKGNIIAGNCAGASLLCNVSLSAVNYKKSGILTPLPVKGIGLIDSFVFVPHFSKDRFRQIQLHEYLTDRMSDNIFGLGIDDCCALIYDGEYCTTISSCPDANIHICHVKDGRFYSFPLQLDKAISVADLSLLMPI